MTLKLLSRENAECPPTPHVNTEGRHWPLGLQFWEPTSQLRTPRKYAGCCQEWGIGPRDLWAHAPGGLWQPCVGRGMGTLEGQARRWPHGAGRLVGWLRGWRGRATPPQPASLSSGASDHSHQPGAPRRDASGFHTQQVLRVLLSQQVWRPVPPGPHGPGHCSPGPAPAASSRLASSLCLPAVCHSEPRASGRQRDRTPLHQAPNTPFRPGSLLWSRRFSLTVPTPPALASLRVLLSGHTHLVPAAPPRLPTPPRPTVTWTPPVPGSELVL